MADAVILELTLDKSMKEDLEAICASMGMSLDTAIRIFFRKLEQERRIPFAIRAEADSFYHPANLSYIDDKIAAYQAGRLKLAEHKLLGED